MPSWFMSDIKFQQRAYWRIQIISVNQVYFKPLLPEPLVLLLLGLLKLTKNGFSLCHNILPYYVPGFYHVDTVRHSDYRCVGQGVFRFICSSRDFINIVILITQESY